MQGNSEMKEPLTFPVFTARGTGWEGLLGQGGPHSSFITETLIQYVPATGQMHPQGSSTIIPHLRLPVSLV